MTFHVSRNGQMYGPYTLADLQRYVQSGNVLLTDLAKSEEMTEWLPVSQVLASSGVADSAGAAGFGAGADPATTPAYGAVPGVPGPQTYPAYGGATGGAADPPNLSWVLVLVLSIVTCGLFSFIWDFVQSAWMRHVQPTSNALFLYIAAFIAELFNASFSVGNMMSLHAGLGLRHHNPWGSLLGLLAFALLIAARFSMRASLEDYYNRVDPIGLRLGPVMTFFFGDLYFQYHFNKINDIKRGMRYRGQAV